MDPLCETLPERDVRFCEAVGYYDASLSPTSSEVAGSQTLMYGIRAASITYVRDSTELPGSKSPPLPLFPVSQEPRHPVI